MTFPPDAEARKPLLSSLDSTTLPRVGRSCRRDEHHAGNLRRCWEQTGGGANDPTEKSSSRRRHGARHRRVASTAFAEEPASFQNRLQGATIGLPWARYASRPLHRAGNCLPWFGLPCWSRHEDVGNWATATGGRVGLPGRRPSRALCSMSRVGLPRRHLLVVGCWAGYVFTTAMGSQIWPTMLVITSVGGGFVVANPTFNPINLSWNLHKWLVRQRRLQFHGPDGAASYAGSGRTPITGRWSRRLRFLLANNWVLSANFFYDFNTSSGGPRPGAGFGCPTTLSSGDVFYGDFTALYKFGKWEFGPVGYFEKQTTHDSGCPTPTAAVCGMLRRRSGRLGRLRLRPGRSSDVDHRQRLAEQRDRRSQLLVRASASGSGHRKLRSRLSRRTKLPASPGF